MSRADRTILHLLPHPGGGGETYVDTLQLLPGYSAERHYLAPSAHPARAAPFLVPGALHVHLRARRFDLLHVHGEVASMFALPSLAGVPSIVTLHGLHLLRRSRGVQLRLARAGLRAVASRACSVICVSESELSEVVGVLRDPSARLVLIPNGVPVPALPTAADGLALRAELGIPPDTAIVLYVGALSEVKEPLVAVRAAADAVARGTRLVLLVVGDGPLRAAVKTAGGDHVRFLGQRQDVARFYAGADVFVLPSRREGMSYSLLEAMSFGAVPVVSDAPGNVEAVGEAGLIVPPGDADALSRALSSLLRDRCRLAEIGASARRRIADHFRFENMLDQTRRVYEEAWARRGARTLRARAS
jgi:glycosyltransferase involved in cell wall biosynthesis